MQSIGVLKNGDLKVAYASGLPLLMAACGRRVVTAPPTAHRLRANNEEKQAQ
jgi:hypothetical protein